MGTSISALLIISVLLTAVVVMFKANQIGAQLLATANKSAAETIAERVNTKIEISSTQSLKDAYELETEHHVSDSEGCRPIYPGIARQGQITTSNAMDCYWFEADSPGQVTFTLDKILESPVPLLNRTGENTLISLDYFAPGAMVTTTNFSSQWTEVRNLVFHRELEMSVPQSSTPLTPHRIKLWTYDGTQSENWGGYQITMAIQGVDSIDISTVSCVSDFLVKNVGATEFTTFQLDQGLEVFLVLDAGNGSTEMKVPVRIDAPLAPDQWNYVISDDSYQVGIFNPGESLKMSINMNNNSDASGTLLVTLPNGVGTSFAFPSICTMP